MSYKSQLQTNNENLQSLIDKANALPDAGSGGGGGSVETYNVSITNNGNQVVEMAYIDATDVWCYTNISVGSSEQFTTKGPISIYDSYTGNGLHVWNGLEYSNWAFLSGKGAVAIVNADSTAEITYNNLFP